MYIEKGTHFMKKTFKENQLNILSKIILMLMFSAVLCACSNGNTNDNIMPLETTVMETVVTETTKEEPILIKILGNEYDINTETLDLSEMKPEDVTTVAKSLCEMSQLKTVNLIPKEDTSLLQLSDVVLLKEAALGTHFVYEFDLYGKHLTTEDTEVKYNYTWIGNDGEETIRQALTILDKCEYFLLDECGISDEIMAGIREDFPNTKVVWRVHVGFKTALTDDPVIRMTHGIDNTMTEPLKYCNDVVYMDLGHDTTLTDISFIKYMPRLECLILSDAQFADLSPVTNCPNLTWLELVYCYHMENLSVISNMDSIKYLNISFTNTTDISKIMNMNLKRFSCIGNPLPEEDFNKFQELHPDCICVSDGNPYGYGWRYNDYGYTFFYYYKRMREVFRYTQTSPGGFKFP